jgi:hypothetical protein
MSQLTRLIIIKLNQEGTSIAALDRIKSHSFYDLLLENRLIPNPNTLTQIGVSAEKRDQIKIFFEKIVK